MYSVSLSTERIRHLLQEFEEKGRRLAIHPSKDIPGPGGGVYITSQTPLNAKHLDWFESRNLSLEAETYVEVSFVREGEGSASSREVRDADQLPRELDIPEESPKSEEEKGKRAEVTSKRVVTTAKKVAGDADKVYRAVGQMDFSMEELGKPDVQESLREFERSIGQFQSAVKKALDEYLNGNTLVMDLIVKFKLDKATVRHALGVAAFATEMAALLALRDEESERQMESYFGDLSNEELFGDLGEELPEEITEELVREARYQLFSTELVEIFLGGFLARLRSVDGAVPSPGGARGQRRQAHLSDRGSPTLRTGACQDRAVPLRYRATGQEVRRRQDHGKARRPSQDVVQERVLRPHRGRSLRRSSCVTGSSHADILSAADLRKILPVALAEYYISHTGDVYNKPHVDVANELAQHIRGGAFQKYMVVLCNSRVDIIAPRRSLVRLGGHISVIVDARGKESRRAHRLELEEYDAGSLQHGGDRNSPHLITLFLRRGDGSREKAEYVSPHEASLWERAAGLDSRMYIPTGRYRNTITFRVTGFMSEEVYEKILGEYEQEFHKGRGCDGPR